MRWLPGQALYQHEQSHCLTRDAHDAERYFRWSSGASNSFPQHWWESVTGEAGSPRVRARSSATVTSRRFSGRTLVMSPFRNSTF